MKKIVSTLGLMIALSLGAIAWFGLPGGSNGMVAQGQALAAGACQPAYVSLDEGYGVSRQILRPCAKD